MIAGFFGQYRFLSNFHELPHKIEFCGHSWSNTENPYQWAKSGCLVDALEEFQSIPPGKAKKLGQQLDVITQWQHKKLSIMTELVSLKFDIPEMTDLLLSTGHEEIIELNYWKDKFYGMVMVDGIMKGENHLGKIIMRKRAQLQGLYVI